ncbi:hypothetical protein EVA_12948 [gut metagenome]|uniref:Uncharacterized protein n=1 Tax=gut metagenome TaxID=749906 RepID=J9FVB8_9ZZZZ
MAQRKLRRFFTGDPSRHHREHETASLRSASTENPADRFAGRIKAGNRVAVLEDAAELIGS